MIQRLLFRLSLDAQSSEQPRIIVGKKGGAVSKIIHFNGGMKNIELSCLPC